MFFTEALDSYAVFFDHTKSCHVNAVLLANFKALKESVNGWPGDTSLTGYAVHRFGWQLKSDPINILLCKHFFCFLRGSTELH